MAHSLYSKVLRELVQDGIMHVSAEGTIDDVNAYLCEMTGLTSDDLVGMKAVDFPFTAESLAGTPFHPVLPAGKGNGIRSLQIRGNDGSLVSVEIRTAVQPDGAYFCLLQNIDEKIRIEEKLRLKSMFLEAVANSSAEGILVVDLKGQKILQNKRTLELWKIDEEVANDPDGSRQVAHVMKMTKNPEQFFAEIEYQKAHPFEITTDTLELIDGTFLHRHSAPVIGEDGNYYGRIYHFHDITSFRKAEEKIRGLLEEKELILREVHHRVKNYMGTLVGLLMYQASTLKEDSAIKALREAQNRILSMMALYDRLYVDTEARSISAAHYFPTLIDDILINFIGYEKIDVEKDIAEIILDANTLQLMSIITNELLTNIMKYAFTNRSKGHISVKLKVEGNTLCYSIKDDGVGITQAGEEETFEGFGLMLVKTLVEQLEGTLKLKNDHGTEVSIVFDIPGPA